MVVLAVIGCARVRVPERAPRRGAGADRRRERALRERPATRRRRRRTRRGRARGAGAGKRRWRPSPILAIVFAIVSLEFGLSFWLASYLNVSVGLERGVAVALVAALYGANLAGRLLASRLARRIAADRLLALALVTALTGLPILLAATSVAAATLGFVITGIGIGAMFPLTSSLHVGESPRDADAALGQVLVTAAFGQTFGPLTVAIIAQSASLRAGLMTLPALVLLAAAALAVYERSPQSSRATAAQASPWRFNRAAASTAASATDSPAAFLHGLAYPSGENRTASTEARDVIDPFRYSGQSKDHPDHQSVDCGG